MHRSSKQRRQKLARRWKRTLFAAAFAASFATGSFAMADSSPAKKKLPTRAVTPVAVTRESTKETTSPAQLAPIVRPGDLRTPAAGLPRKTTLSSPAAKLLGAKNSSFRPVAIEAISKEETSDNSAEPAPLQVVTPLPSTPKPEVKAKAIPSKPVVGNKPQVLENEHVVRSAKAGQPADNSSAQEEKPAPIVLASSFARQPKKVEAPSRENLPVAEDNGAAASPLSPWMQDIRGPKKELAPAVQEEALPTEYPATEAATIEPAVPESAIEPAATESALEPAAVEPAPMPVTSPRSTRVISPASPAKLTLFERAAVPAFAEVTPEVEQVVGKSPEKTEEPAEFVPPEEAAPIVSAPKRNALVEESPELKRNMLPAKPLRPSVIVNPKVSGRENSETRFQRKAESLVQAVQDAQPAPLPGPDKDADLKKHFEVIQQTGEFSVQVHRSKLLRTAKDIYRTAVVDDAVLEIVQFTPREISLIGRSQGSTHVTFWFDDPAAQPVTYLVTVEPDAGQVAIDEKKYQLLEDMINEMFPDSKIHLQLIANKLVVRGQARDCEEAAQIMSLIRAQGGFGGGGGIGGPGGAGFAGINEGPAAEALQDSATGAARRSNYQLINMLRVPGIQQVALRVKIAELNRTAARNFGMNVQGRIDLSSAENGSKVLLNSILGTGGTTQPAVLANIDGDDISFGLSTLTQAGVIKLLSEPTLVTLSGNPATFIAGGEFAVPTIVGSAGLNAVTTDFRAFGAIISFLPTVVDKDRIRLQVAPEFSQINAGLTVNGTPGLKVRAATTTVEMREGQTLAIAGLLEDSINANTAGDIPYLSRWIGKRGVTRAETELIILVTPELVHPMEPEEVPPLPGFDVTEPTNKQFYYHGDIEGNPTMDYRSTVWPRLKKRYKAGGPAMTSGPFGHGQ